jgi:ABC-type proline/glycine betaine transport system permease subunit
MDSIPNIFITRSECEKNIVLSKFEVMRTIPTVALLKHDVIAMSTSKELRWRIFKLPHKENEIIEISHKLPNEPRMFMNKSGKWVNREISNEYNQFLRKEYYVYEDLQISYNLF